MISTEGHVERFHTRYKVDKNGCWLWQGHIHPKTGYTVFCSLGKPELAHRYSYKTFNGPLIEGLVIDHLCRVRHCVNPKHLDQVTQTENMRRGIKWESLKTHCPRGHQYDYLHKNKRKCKQCRKINMKDFYKRVGGNAKYLKEWRVKRCKEKTS